VASLTIAARRARIGEVIACRSWPEIWPRLWGGLWGEIENAAEVPMKSAPTGGLPLRHMGHCPAKAMDPTLESEQCLKASELLVGTAA